MKKGIGISVAFVVAVLVMVPSVFAADDLAAKLQAVLNQGPETKFWQVSADEVNAMIAEKKTDFVVVDVRPNPAEFSEGHIPGAIAIATRLDVRRIQAIKLGSEIIGSRTRVRVVKNKVAAPFRTAEFDIMYNEGISRSGDLIDLATGLDIITKRGSFYSYGDIPLGQGGENPKDFLKNNADLAEEVEPLRRVEAGLVAVLRDRDALHELHHEVRAAALGRARVEDLRDVLVVHQRERLPLRLEARDHLPRVHAELDDLERDRPADRLGLLGLVDDAEAASLRHRPVS